MIAVVNFSMDKHTHVPFACLVGEKRADDERFSTVLSGMG